MIHCQLRFKALLDEELRDSIWRGEFNGNAAVSVQIRNSFRLDSSTFLSKYLQTMSPAHVPEVKSVVCM